jgi:hypothetical protein
VAPRRSSPEKLLCATVHLPPPSVGVCESMSECIEGGAPGTRVPGRFQHVVSELGREREAAGGAVSAARRMGRGASAACALVSGVRGQRGARWRRGKAKSPSRVSTCAWSPMVLGSGLCVGSAGREELGVCR